MRWGFLASAAGLEIEGQVLDDQVRQQLYRQAQLFLEAGGVVDLATWAGLSDLEREVLADAGTQLWLERAGAIGLAGSRTGLAGALAAGMDYEDLQVRAALQHGLAAARRLRVDTRGRRPA